MAKLTFGRMGRLFHVPSEACSAGTAQTAGMTGLAALSGDSVGSRVVIARTTQDAIVENLTEL